VPRPALQDQVQVLVGFFSDEGDGRDEAVDVLLER
jgi:hypothetical protein